MNYNKYRKTLNIIFLNILIIVTVLILSGVVFKESKPQIIMAAEEPILGYRISNPLPLGTITNVASSNIEWKATTDEGITSITIKTAVTIDGENPPAFDSEEWQVASSGESIIGINPGDNLAEPEERYLWTMQILESTAEDVSPALHSLTETIEMETTTEGFRISPKFDISSLDMVKDSRIFWQADEKFDGNINIKVSVLTNGEWTYEQEIVNGGEIPGLGPGASLAGAKIQTKASFVGGPEFYPSLENIKIFIETE